MGQLTDVFTDIVAEGEALDKVLAGLDDAQWARPTPAPGWTVRHQVAHMASVFRIAGLAASDPDLFVRQTAGAERDFDAAVGELLKPYLGKTWEFGPAEAEQGRTSSASSGPGKCPGAMRSTRRCGPRRRWRTCRSGSRSRTSRSRG